jgi:hypothetical protein
MQKLTISAACFKFTKHLSETATLEILNRSHGAMDADPEDLKRWRISRREWSLACSAVAEARKTGRDPEDFLKSTQDLLNSLANTRVDNAGNQVCEMSFEVGGAGKRQLSNI